MVVIININFVLETINVDHTRGNKFCLLCTLKSLAIQCSEQYAPVGPVAPTQLYKCLQSKTNNKADDIVCMTLKNINCSLSNTTSMGTKKSTGCT